MRHTRPLALDDVVCVTFIWFDHHRHFKSKNCNPDDWIFWVTCYLFGCSDDWPGLFSFWTARGTNVRPRVWRRPKLIDEGDSEVLSLETAETRLSMFSWSTCIAVNASSVLCIACLRWVFCLCFFDGLDFLKNSNEEGNLCLSTRCCCRFL